MLDQQTIGFIGGGNMAQAIMGGLINAGFAADHLWISDPDHAKLTEFSNRTGVKIANDNEALVTHAEVVVLAVKPQVMADVLKPLAASIQRQQPLLISVAAGIPIQLIQAWTDADAAVVRVMPNTPALVRAGASGLYAAEGVSEAHRSLAESIMRAVGVVVWVDNEYLIDSVTAVSGSGPAYFFYLMEVLAEAGIKQGLSEDQARLLSIETAFGAAKLALESDYSAAELRRRVTSPGGTTEAAIAQMQQQGFSVMVDKAVAAAVQRSAELAQLAGDKK